MLMVLNLLKRSKISIFVPQRRLVGPIYVKFGTADGTWVLCPCGPTYHIISYHSISPTFTKPPLSQCSTAPYNRTDRVLFKKK